MTIFLENKVIGPCKLENIKYIAPDTVDLVLGIRAVCHAELDAGGNLKDFKIVFNKPAFTRPLSKDVERFLSLQPESPLYCFKHLYDDYKHYDRDPTDFTFIPVPTQDDISNFLADNGPWVIYTLRYHLGLPIEHEFKYWGSKTELIAAFVREVPRDFEFLWLKYLRWNAAEIAGLEDPKIAAAHFLLLMASALHVVT